MTSPFPATSSNTFLHSSQHSSESSSSSQHHIGDNNNNTNVCAVPHTTTTTRYQKIISMASLPSCQITAKIVTADCDTSSKGGHPHQHQQQQQYHLQVSSHHPHHHQHQQNVTLSDSPIHDITFASSSSPSSSQFLNSHTPKNNILIAAGEQCRIWELETNTASTTADTAPFSLKKLAHFTSNDMKMFQMPTPVSCIGAIHCLGFTDTTTSSADHRSIICCLVGMYPMSDSKNLLHWYHMDLGTGKRIKRLGCSPIGGAGNAAAIHGSENSSSGGGSSCSSPNEHLFDIRLVHTLHSPKQHPTSSKSTVFLSYELTNLGALVEKQIHVTNHAIHVQHLRRILHSTPLGACLEEFEYSNIIVGKEPPGSVASSLQYQTAADVHHDMKIVGVGHQNGVTLHVELFQTRHTLAAKSHIVELSFGTGSMGRATSSVYVTCFSVFFERNTQMLYIFCGDRCGALWRSKISIQDELMNSFDGECSVHSLESVESVRMGSYMKHLCIVCNEEGKYGLECVSFLNKVMRL